MALFITIAVTLAVAPALVFPQTTQEVLSNLAAQIAERRARVETLSDQIQQTRDDYNEQVRSLATQIADVEIQINREELRIAQIQQDIDAARAAIALAQDSVAEVAPVASTVFALLREHIETGLPFKVQERLKEVDDLERLFGEGSIDPQVVLTRLWNMVEAEFRLTEESGLFRQTILVDADQQLAEVARLGMVLLYFKTFDDRYGFAVPDGQGGWSYVIARTRDESEQIEVLFESLRRNLREGFFTLPNPYEGR